MRIQLVHLSDIHFLKVREKNPILTRIESLVAGVRSRLEQDLDALFVVFSGDTAFSGLEEEFEYGLEFFIAVVSLLQAECRSPIIVTLVPGNHDCDFSQNTETRSLILQHFQSHSAKDDSMVRTALAVQAAYESFAAKLKDALDVHSCVVLTEWASKSVVNIGDETISLQLLNSAWCSAMHEKPGQLAFPVNLLHESMETQSVAELSVSVIHHPYNWFEPNVARELWNWMTAASDVIITGHEHINAVFQKKPLGGDTYHFVEGGVLQESGVPNESTFNLLTLDTKRQEISTSAVSWNPRTTEYTVVSETSPEMFLRNNSRRKKSLPFELLFENWLNDPGAKFSHPTKKALTLDDIFVYPDFTQLKTDAGKPAGGIIGGDSICALLQSEKKALIIGAEASGKTSFCKQLIRQMHTTGIRPLYVDGHSVKRFGSNIVRDTCTSAVKQMYGSSQTDSYWQLPKDMRAVLVDDFHRLPGKDRDRFLDAIVESFGIVVLTGSDDVRVSELQRQGKTALWEFKHLELMELGFVARSKLIKRWYHANPDTLAPIAPETVKWAEEQVTEFVGEEFMPAHPIFVLAVLQQLELKQPHEFVSSAVGYMYEVLVLEAVAHAQTNDADIDTNKNYLAEFAFQLFTDGVATMTKTDAESWHYHYCDRFRYSFDFSTQVNALQKSSILQIRNGNIGFLYPYLFYYFVAKYLADHLNDPSVRKQVSNLCSYLHQVDAANIVLFLCHHSRDPFILESVVATARGLFSNYEECQLDEDVKGLEFSTTDSLKLQQLDPADDPEKNRQETLVHADAKSQMQKSDRSDELDVSVTEPCELHNLNDQMQFNAALKSMQILGQILRNHIGSLPGEVKVQLTEVTMQLGLKGMRCLLNVFEGNQDEMVQELVEVLERRQSGIPRHKLAEDINRSLWNTLELGTVAIAKYTASSLGIPKLADVLREVVDAKGTIAARVVDLSVKLDHFEGFPKKETLKLAQDLEKNPFAFAVVRDLVWLRFYLHREDYKIVQAMTQKLNISQKNNGEFIAGPHKRLSKTHRRPSNDNR